MGFIDEAVVRGPYWNELMRIVEERAKHMYQRTIYGEPNPLPLRHPPQPLPWRSPLESRTGIYLGTKAEAELRRMHSVVLAGEKILQEIKQGGSHGHYEK